MKNNAEQGNEFEVFLRNTFSSLKKTYGLSYHRFVDTRAAGNVVASQPSDFLVGVDGTLFYVEAKTSVEENFSRSMLRPHQRKAILFDSKLLNIPYWILFWSVTDQRVSVIDGVKAMEGTRINIENCAVKCTREELSDLLIKMWNPTTMKELLVRSKNG
jgi:hypothetical protein